MKDRLEKLKEFWQVNPQDSFIQHAMALEYIKLGDDLQALQLFKDLLQRDENYTGSYYHLARLLERAGSMDEAKLCYEKGMDRSRQMGEWHVYNELKAAYEDLIY